MCSSKWRDPIHSGSSQLSSRTVWSRRGVRHLLSSARRDEIASALRLTRRRSPMNTRPFDASLSPWSDSRVRGARPHSPGASRAEGQARHHRRHLQPLWVSGFVGTAVVQRIDPRRGAAKRRTEGCSAVASSSSPSTAGVIRRGSRRRPRSSSAFPECRRSPG